MGTTTKIISLYKPSTWKEKGLKWTMGMLFITLILLIMLLMFFWSREPDFFDVNTHAQTVSEDMGVQVVTGFTTTATLSHLMATILDKAGGFTENDKMPPGILMDNMPNWEFGVLVQSRDMALVLRNDLSRSQSQSTEDKDLVNAATKFHTDSKLWILPPAESQYRDGIKSLNNYLNKLAKPDEFNSQFYARADNLVDWLGLVKKRLGSLSQRLSASVGKEQLNTDLAGDSEAKQSTPNAASNYIKTDWFEIDDVFYEARGQTWALIHLMRAIEKDFGDVLRKKNALISLRQIIRELEGTQQTMWSPIILNGKGFGLVTNHSLVMASYISRANAALIDLERLLQRG